MERLPALPVVTCDLFSALLDSRSGGTAALTALRLDWGRPAADVYDHWDAASKSLQADCASWVPFAELARQALERTYLELGLPGSASRDIQPLLASVADWPLWPDVAQALPALQAVARVGVLSNVDDSLLGQTRAAGLVDLELALTSQQLRAYKPRPELYRAARARLGPFVHVASSARDVRGALEAGLTVIRLARPGHLLDPAGPVPTCQVVSFSELPTALERLAQR